MNVYRELSLDLMRFGSFPDKKLKKKLEKLQSTTSAQTKEYKCLLRAVLGSRKISTVVTPQEAMKFQASYSILLRGKLNLHAGV